MHTLEELRLGKLQGIKHLNLSENLTSFPMEVLALADSLEILDLSNNKLSSLPSELAQLKKLKILFLSFNNFVHVPKELRAMKSLYMVGFKSNKIEQFDEDVLPLSISWLILTDNKIKKLPSSMGDLVKLQKCALAGNEIEELPKSMSACVNLELIRLSANNLKEMPDWLLNLSKLSWLAFSGNPCVKPLTCNVDTIRLEDLEMQELLGEGASGVIHKVYSQEHGKHAALKVFKGAVTSDGYAQDEMDSYIHVNEHENLISVLAKLDDEDKLGLLLEYIPASFYNLGNPPNFDTCTRDTFEGTFEIETIYAIAKAIHSVCVHLHEQGLMHGDLYAHNILIDDKNTCYLGDFGAATFYDRKNKKYEKIEVRAYGCLLDDLLQRCDDRSSYMYKSLDVLREQCFVENVDERIEFKDMVI